MKSVSWEVPLMDWISEMNKVGLTEVREIKLHRAECSAARSARGDRYSSAEVGGCYWAEDNWWVDCPKVFEIMRAHDEVFKSMRSPDNA
jgi:hypothetical protein